MLIQQAVDRREVNVVADSLLIGSLDRSLGGNLALDRSRKKGRELLPLLLARKSLMVTASLANRLHRLGAQPIVGRDQCMHRRFPRPRTVWRCLRPF